MSRPRLNGPLSLTVVIWGYNFVSLKLLYREMPAGVVAVVRFLLMWGTLWLLCLATRRLPKIEKGDRLRILGSGFLSMGLYMSLFLSGMAGTTPAEGAIMLATAPVLTYLISLMLKWERYLPVALAGTLMAFGGVAIIVGAAHSGHGSLRGNGLVFASAIVWAVSALAMRPLVGKYDPLAVLTYSMPGALPALLMYGGAATLAYDPSHLTYVGVLNLGQAVFFSGVLAFLSFYKGLSQVGPAMATAYQFCVPVIATFFGWVFFRHTLVPLQWIGVMAVLSGVGTASWARARAAR
ncbi:DMT family transporter [soil metagenome]